MTRQYDPITTKNHCLLCGGKCKGRMDGTIYECDADRHHLRKIYQYDQLKGKATNILEQYTMWIWTGDKPIDRKWLQTGSSYRIIGRRIATYSSRKVGIYVSPQHDNEIMLSDHFLMPKDAIIKWERLRIFA